MSNKEIKMNQVPESIKIEPTLFDSVRDYTTCNRKSNEHHKIIKIIKWRTVLKYYNFNKIAKQDPEPKTRLSRSFTGKWSSPERKYKI